MVKRIQLPAFHFTIRTADGVTMFFFKSRVLQQVFYYAAVFNSPIRLVTEVFGTQSVYRHAVTIDEHALVGSNGNTISVILAIVVVECTGSTFACSSRVGQADFAVRSVIDAYVVCADKCLEAGTFFSNCVCVERLCSIVGLYAEFNSVTVVAGSETVGNSMLECFIITGSFINRIL